MPKILLIYLLAIVPCLLSAQEKLRLSQGAIKSAFFQKPTPEWTNKKGSRDLPSVPLLNSFLNQEALVGMTLYDIQTNASSQNRLVVDENSGKAAVWMFSQSSDPTFPDRGTGFNEYKDGSWGQLPTTRIESSRTGWPSLVRLSDGTLHVTTHSGGQNLMSLRREPGSSDWTEANILNNTPHGLLWPRTAAGGPDGKTIHLLALTTPADGLGGSIYRGMNGHPLYARSLDGGLTWDMIDVVIPGLDSTTYREIEGDSYTMVARGEIVAIVIFGLWGDVALYKSFDNGVTWERTIINDFPLDKYRVDQGYTVADIPSDPFAPNRLAINTSDGSGGAAIDVDGLVHVTYADAYVMDSVLNDSLSSFFPGWSGINYWNETRSEPALVASFIDYNGNDTIDLAGDALPRYGNGTSTSMPVIATDEQDGIYIVYSMVAEGFFNELQAQNYRHLVAVKSIDGGETWGPEYDIINPELSDPEVYDFIEAVFPSMYGLVNDTLHILYQQDFFPGYRSFDEDDPLADNFAAYTGVPVRLIPAAGSVSTQEVLPLDFHVFPNPANEVLNVSLNGQQTGEAVLELFNAQGQRILSKQDISQTIGLDLSSLNTGVYFLKISIQNRSGFKIVLKGLH